MNKQELKLVLELHDKSCRSEEGGKRANLTDANLRGANLDGANLRDANLTDAILTDAILDGANLWDANLTDANLRDANLRGANLASANLTGANLPGANLRGASLWDANLADANLTDANLAGASLTDANLADANLTDAILTGANLTGANLTGANLTDANLEQIKQDFFHVLGSAKSEALGLYDALCRGIVDGSQYEGECACLVGTVANLRKEHHERLGVDLKPDSRRPAERWFLAIRKGDTPQNNPVSEITAAWMREWMDANAIAYPEYAIQVVQK